MLLFTWEFVEFKMAVEAHYYACVGEGDVDQMRTGFYTLFQKHYPTYLTQTVETILRTLGQHTVFALEAYKRHRPTANDVRDFIILFIEEQLGHMEDWCPALRHRLYMGTA